MLEFLVQNQTIKRLDKNQIVANSQEYLTADYSFTNDWAGLSKTAIFTSGTESIAIILDENNQITEDKQLNLTAGRWIASVVGILGTKKIITNVVSITVIDSGADSGEEPAEPTPDVYEQIITQYTNLINMISIPATANTIVERDENADVLLNALKLSDTPTVPTEIGSVYYDTEYETISAILSNNVNMQIGQEMFAYAENNTGTTIENGTIVYWSETVGASGKLRIAPYIANGTIEAERILGITTEDIASGESGLIARYGGVRGINTTGSAVGETWSSGTVLYAHPTIAGKMTSVKPTTYERITRIGVVVYSGATNGSMAVNISHSNSLATQTYAGLMSPADKAKLDAL